MVVSYGHQIDLKMIITCNMTGQYGLVSMQTNEYRKIEKQIIIIVPQKVQQFVTERDTHSKNRGGL